MCCCDSGLISMLKWMDYAGRTTYACIDAVVLKVKPKESLWGFSKVQSSQDEWVFWSWVSKPWTQLERSKSVQVYWSLIWETLETTNCTNRNMQMKVQHQKTRCNVHLYLLAQQLIKKCTVALMFVKLDCSFDEHRTSSVLCLTPCCSQNDEHFIFKSA